MIGVRERSEGVAKFEDLVPDYAGGYLLPIGKQRQTTNLHLGEIAVGAKHCGSDPVT